MSNKASPKKHGLVGADMLRPKASSKKRANKAKLRPEQTARQAAIREAIGQAGK